MLRRRIFASAMASVMAISSVAVVASADETAEAVEAAKNVKSQDDLKKLVEDNEAMRSDGIYDYGSVSGQEYLDALEYADNVLADSSATAVDYTVAYKMIEETKAALHIYSAEDLKALIDGCQKIYDTENIMNEELNDLIYEDDTVDHYNRSFTNFADCFEKAEGALNSTDTRIITDAYDNLLNAKNNLKALATVTKSQFRAAMKAYEALALKVKDYDTWRRGTVGGWVDVASDKYWIFGKNSYQTFDDVLNVIFRSGAVTKKGEWWGEVVVQGATGVSHGQNSPSCTTTVEQFINEQYEIFANVKESNKTTREDIVKACRAAQDAVAVFENWAADDTNRATKSSVQKLLDQYHNQLVATFRTSDDAEALFELLAPTETVPSDWKASASLKNAGDGKVVINVDDNYYWNSTDAKTKELKVAKRVDILKYIKVTSADVAASQDAWKYTNLIDAMKWAELYLAERYSNNVYGLDETGDINTANGSVAEWTLVYRNLKYALEDVFPASTAATYTRADVKTLINDCYDLAEKVGDSAIFNKEADPADEVYYGTLHTSMVEARQIANDWLKAANADKSYKDGDSAYFVNAFVYSNKDENVIDSVGATLNSTGMYEYLEAFYKRLNDEFAKYQYSYGEIYDYISDVSEMIDDGELEPKDDLVKALKETAYNLSVLVASDEDDNAAFTSDREFNAINRLFTDKDNANNDEKALKSSYEALLAAVKAQTEVTAVLGDINGDGVVTAADASEILKAVVGLRDAIANEVGDYNNDGSVTAADASAILKAVIGL